MKKIATIISVFILSIGCSDDLERLPLNSIGAPSFWKTAEDATLGINGVYNVLTNGHMYNDFMNHSDALSDNAYSPDSFRNYLEISEGVGFDASSVWPDRIWKISYQGIVRANQVLTNVPDIEMDEGTKKRILGEASFLRALFYFHLTNLFGDVPLITSIQTIPESLVPRDLKSTVVGQIIKDLDFAASEGTLPTSYSSKEEGRVTKGAALALKSRVHLYNGNYTEAVTAANDVISLGYDLLPAEDYSLQFLPDMENNGVESIFEVQFKGGTGANLGSSFNTRSGALPNFGNYFLPLKNLVDEYESNDIRLAATILQPGEVFAGVSYDPSTSATGFSVRKSLVEDATVTFDGDANFVVLRFAEILLNLAEAQNELTGPNAVVYDAINRIRNRAGLTGLPIDLTKEDMRQAIRKERRLELAFEGHRYFDLLRYGPAEMEAAMNRVTSVVGHTRVFEDRFMLWPIPQVEILINPNLKPQNSGW